MDCPECGSAHIEKPANYCGCKVSVRKFVEWETGAQIEIDDPVEWLRKEYSLRRVDQNLLRHGVYHLYGWEYNLRPYLKRFVYRQYDRWWQAYAPNRTMLRKQVIGRVPEILEATKR